MGKAYRHMLEITVVLAGGQTNLKEKKSVRYTVEREYLAKISVEELLIRIVKAHLDQEIAKKDIAR